MSLRLRIVNKSVAAGASTASANHTQTEMYQGHRRTTCWNILCQDWKGLSTSTPCQPETFFEIMKSLLSRLKDLGDLDRTVWAVSEMLRRCLGSLPRSFVPRGGTAAESSTGRASGRVSKAYGPKRRSNGEDRRIPIPKDSEGLLTKQRSKKIRRTRRSELQSALSV